MMRRVEKYHGHLLSTSTHGLMATIIYILSTCRIYSIPHLPPQVIYHYGLRLWVDVQAIKIIFGWEWGSWVWSSGSPLLQLLLVQRFVNWKKLLDTPPRYPHWACSDETRMGQPQRTIKGELWELLVHIKPEILPGMFAHSFYSGVRE